MNDQTLGVLLIAAPFVLILGYGFWVDAAATFFTLGVMLCILAAGASVMFGLALLGVK